MSQSQRKNDDLIQRADAAESSSTAISTDSTTEKPHLAFSMGSKLASMPRSLSLKNRERIRELFRSAKRRSSSSLTVFYRISIGAEKHDNGSNTPARWLVAIPKRTGNAVRRNKLRRALRETIRLWPNRSRVEGEIIVRYNPPRSLLEKSQRKGGVRKILAPLEKSYTRALREELLGLLDGICLGLEKMKS